MSYPCPLYDPLPPLSLLRSSAPLQPSFLSTALCLLYSCSPPRPRVPSEVLCPLYGPLSPLQPCLLYGPLSSLWPSVPSVALWQTGLMNRPFLFCKMFCKTRFVKAPRVIPIYIFHISDRIDQSKIIYSPAKRNYNEIHRAHCNNSRCCWCEAWHSIAVFS